MEKPTKWTNWVLSLNKDWANKSDWYTQIYHHWLVWLLVVIGFFYSTYVLIKSKFREHQIEFLCAATCFGIIIGSNLAEYSQTRLILPAMPFLIIACHLYLDKISSYVIRSVKRSN